MGFCILIINLRSSSLNSYLSCHHRYLLEYVLNIKTDGNAAACYGTTFHKVMELLNKQAFAKQKGETSFVEGDAGVTFNVKTLTKNVAIKWAFDYYKEKNPRFTWDELVLADLHQWTDYVLNSHYSPEKTQIFGVEHFFEYEIKEDWAAYEFEVDGEIISGHLKVRGTMDLLLKPDADYLEYLDYKTSSRPMYDWATKKTKTLEELKYDNQLLLYYFSLRKLFPDYKHIGMTLFFTRKGPYPVIFGDEEYYRAEALIKNIFTEIKNDENVSWVYNDKSKNHQCSYCSLNRNNDPKTKKPLCLAYRDELTTLGLQKLVDKYVNVPQLSNYVGGGSVRTNEKVT